MACPLSLDVEENLGFFGRVSASISHELKNALSIMNESAGLLEDLSLLAEKGRPLESLKVKGLGSAIRRQIQRTDIIIRNMNRFSHTVDSPFKEIEVGDFLGFILAVCHRLTSAKGISVTIAPPHQPIRIVTRPFFFHRLIWVLLEYAMGLAGQTKALTLAPECVESSLFITFIGLEELSGKESRICLHDEENRLLRLLEGTMKIDFEGKALILYLPLDLQAEPGGIAAPVTLGEGGKPCP